MSGKKLGFLLTFVLLASLLLAACANNNGNVNDNGLGNNTGVLETDIPVTGDEDLVETPMATEPLVETPVVPEEPIVETPLATEVPVVETPLATEAATDDVVAEGEDLECSPYRLSNLLDAAVVTSDGVVVGEVENVVVFRPGNAAYGVDEGLFSDEPAATEGDVAPAITLPVSAPAPVVGYVLVEIDDVTVDELSLEGDGEFILPFSAFTPIAADNEADVAEDAAGDDDAVEEAGCNLVLNLVGTDLQTAPLFENDTVDFTVADWDAEVVAWTEGLGFANPAAPFETDDTEVEGNYAVFEDGVFDQVDIDVENLEDEDLGEMEEFIINPQDGTLTHGILLTNSFLGLGGTSIPVPTTHMLWVNADDDLEDLGEIVIPVSEDTFENAPEFDLDATDFTVDTWDDEWEAFWANITGEPVTE